MQTRRKYRLFWLEEPRGTALEGISSSTTAAVVISLSMIRPVAIQWRPLLPPPASRVSARRITTLCPGGWQIADFASRHSDKARAIQIDTYLRSSTAASRSSPAKRKRFDELLQWRAFSLTLPRGARQVVALPKFLSEVSDRQLWAMRRAMTHAWPRMLWSSVVQLVPGERERHGLKPEDEDTSYVGERYASRCIQRAYGRTSSEDVHLWQGRRPGGPGRCNMRIWRSRRPRSRHGSRP